MRLVLFLAFRNLFRQKRRNLLLGVAIGFGMMILVLANSFSHGISDNILNKMVVYMVGHMEVSIMEKSKQYSRVIRDRERFVRIIRKNVPDIKEIVESVGVLTRVVGNGKSDNSIVVGLVDTKENSDYFKNAVVAGTAKEFYKDDIENPAVIYEEKAKALNVKLNDTIKIRLKTVSGQEQSARLTVVGIMRSNNIFESFAIFIDLAKLKKLMDMKPYETGALQVNFHRVNDPRFAIKYADKLHSLLKPGIAVIYGDVSKGKRVQKSTTLGFFNSEKELGILKKNIRMVKGELPDSSTVKKRAAVSSPLARSLGLRVGDSFESSYPHRFEKREVLNTYRVSGIFDPGAAPAGNLVLLNENEFYRTYQENLPPMPENLPGAYVPQKGDPLYAAFSPEWRLLERSPDEEALKKKISNMNRTRWKGPWLDVRTMYEAASGVLELERALNIITMVAVLILFFIILIGVINSLRMTVRERTREIGTVRAIGMQRSDVRNLFISETVLLSFFASAAGIAAAFIIMKLLALFTIDTDSVLSILLVEKHLYFMPTVLSILGNLTLILLISGFTAYFPARRAANLSAAAALGHFE